MELIQTIRNEIERRITDNTFGAKLELIDILAWLDTLEESEKPMNQEGLQEEIARTYHDGSVADTSDIDHVSYENIAEYFYELGCRRTAEKYDEIEYNRQRAEEETPNELEEAAWDCVLDSVDVNNPVLLPKYKELLTYLFIAGAKWDRQQMLKEAVEGYVVKDITGSLAVTAKGINLDGFKFGDKVRIIIVKEDGK